MINYSKLSSSSYFPQDEFIDRLKQDFPQVFTEGQIDSAKLQANLKGVMELGERYSLSWKGKSNVYNVIQSTITKTLHPSPEESVNFDTTDNLFIEGDNLDALKILQRAYYGKIKMIYIDPPYNTGNDFVYNDHFQQDKEDYDRESGKRNEAGYLTSQTALQKNTKDSGHYHSNWLNMMYPRLYLARNLLRDDGVIFVSIDDNEVHNLRLIMNEIFGEENFIAQFVWKTRQASGKQVAFNNLSVEHEYVITYQKSEAIFQGTDRNRDSYKNPDNDPRGNWAKHPLDVGSTKTERPNCYYDLIDPITKNVYHANPNRVWAFSPPSMRTLLDDKKIIFDPLGKTKPYLKKFWSELQSEHKPISTWLDKNVFSIGFNTEGTKDINNLFEGKKIFDYPKPVSLLKLFTKQITQDNNIILDFFAGSGTSAHAVMDLNAEDGGNRKWICVQLDEKTDEESEAYKAGYKTISDIAKERIRRAGKKIGKGDVGFKVLKIGETNLKIWDSTIKDPTKLQKQMELMQNVVKDGTSEEDLLLELMVKSGVEPTAKRAKVGKYWNINDGSLIICLAKEMTEDIWSSILKAKPQKLIFLDSSLAGNDQLKTNLILKAEKEKIEIVVV